MVPGNHGQLTGDKWNTFSHAIYVGRYNPNFSGEYNILFIWEEI